VNAVLRRVPELDAFEEQRVHALTEMIRSLSQFTSSEDDSPFATLFQYAQSLLELDDRELSAELQVSRPTIGRWARGESAPHPLGQRAVMQTLSDLANVRLRRHARANRQAADALAI
jgi:hypothetical protein